MEVPKSRARTRRRGPSVRALLGYALLAISAACDNVGQAKPQVPAQLEITCAGTDEIAHGRSATLAAVAEYADGTRRDVSDLVSWEVSNATVLELRDLGQGVVSARAKSVGQSTLRATWPLGVAQASLAVQVLPAELESLEVTPVNASLAKGTQRSLTATGRFSDDSVRDLSGSVYWSSSAPLIASVDGNGNAQAVDTGVAMIRAESGTVSATTSLTVTSASLMSITITPSLPSIALGTDQQLTAIGVFSDSTTQNLTNNVTWTSGTPGVASINSSGLVSSAGVGTTTITARHEDTAVEGTTQLTVTSAVLVSLAVDPSMPTIALGRQQQFTATGTFSDSSTQDLTSSVAWTSSSGSVASVSNASGTEGLASSASVGTSTIRATHTESSVTSATTLTVTPALLVFLAVTPTSPSIALGTGQQFTATGTFSDSTTQDLTATVTWSSSNLATATISNADGTRGASSSQGVGSTTITALDSGSSISGATTLTVTPAVLVSIAVTPSSPSIALGLTRQFTATGTYSDASQQDLTTSITWSSSDTDVATISNAGGSQGLASSASVGTTTITATDSGTSVAGTTTLTVTPATLVSLAVTPADASLLQGNTLQYTATGTFSDSTVDDLTDAVTWSSSAPAVATVSNAEDSEGLATGVAAGVTTIQATHPATSISDSTSLTVQEEISLRAASQAADTDTTLAIATPTGNAEGDLMLASIAIRPSSATITAPAGWSLLRRVDSNDASGGGVPNSLAIYTRTASASEAATHTWTFSSSSGCAGSIASFVGVDTSSPIDAEAGQATPMGLSHTAPSITTSTANTMLVASFCYSSSSPWTAPTGMTEIADVTSRPPVNSAGIAMCTATESFTGPGSTGTRTASITNHSDIGNAVLIALRRAP